jgi:hypothetical protein
MPIPSEIPLSKHFTNERIIGIEKYAQERLESLVRGLRDLRSDKIKRWRKIYDGTPRERTKSFPWQNASNLVIQLVGSFSDQLVAKIVMSEFGVDPFWPAELVGEFERDFHAEEMRSAVQEMMEVQALEPKLLNLLPKYTIWTRTFVKYGFGAIKAMPEKNIEQVAMVEDQGRVLFEDYVKHEGPICLPIMFEDFLMPATTIELERAPFIAQRARLQKFQVEQFRWDKTFNRGVITEILKRPTRTGPSDTQRDIENESGARTDSGSTEEEWDFYEMHFPYQVMGKRFQLILTGCADDMGTDLRVAKSVFNWLPDNSLPYIGARLGNDGERAYGKGFCEMLRDYQEEISAIHNRRGDASTAANTNIFRFSPGQQLDAQFSIYPMAGITAEKDGFEVVPLGRTANETIKDEQLVLQEAQDRAGVGPSSSGQGAGTVNKKGAYSAMGTFAVMQEGNTRANLNVTEFRQSHYSLGSLVLAYHAHFGIPEKDKKAYGEQAQWLDKALELVKQGRLIIPIRAATGSVNKEIEKQNLMLLLNNWRAHGQMVSQLLQQASNPMAPPQLQDYLGQLILGGNLLMTKICKDFGISDPSFMIPEPMGIQEKADAFKKQVDQAKALQAQQEQRKLGQGGQPPGVQMPQVQAEGAPGAGSGEPQIQ